MHRNRFRAGPLLALGAILVMGGCGKTGGGPATDRPGLVGGWSTAGCGVARAPAAGVMVPAPSAKVDAVLARIDGAGRTDFAASFAGVEVDQRRVRAVVYRVPSSAFDEFIRRSAEDTCILVRDAAHSAARLAYWHDRVLADLAFWTDRRIRIVTIGARHDGTGVEIGTRDLARARTELTARYGGQAPLILVESGCPKFTRTGQQPDSC